MVKRAAAPDPATAFPVLRSAGQKPFTGARGLPIPPPASRFAGPGRFLNPQKIRERRAGVTLRSCGRGSDRSRVRAVGAPASALDGALPAPLGDGAASPWALHGRGERTLPGHFLETTWPGSWAGEAVDGCGYVFAWHVLPYF
ncbi:hypothetical protein EMIHUDRAFT_311090 [Emiliania huxleyi CCMP1516]|uniref:Uncharacterized protein n=2 Tax=Emiliania huxleyi TaxID=2903 RepID=A0A0D3ISV6_EMIH1|nr:hypothetical protein EMIHUDRAFT_311090 [Emiliania huxleyi CCMP1516]EOD14341.1 hypothetical protein EMIHUDRAFT_311090 [Emiliania huxleyi CCMP1516]|eukprot:XP_005766770.1 hypothetical protein EMIHUDRAFT_311090 [Emiliania huxleyi CCMP1516]